MNFLLGLGPNRVSRISGSNCKKKSLNKYIELKKGERKKGSELCATEKYTLNFNLIMFINKYLTKITYFNLKSLMSNVNAFTWMKILVRTTFLFTAWKEQHIILISWKLANNILYRKVFKFILVTMFLCSLFAVL